MTEDKQILEIDIDLLQPNPLQARSTILPENLVDLVESIKIHGVLEPLVVAKTPAGYQIIAGERRWRASKIVGLKKVPAVIKEVSTRGMLEMALVENVQREDLNPIERAQAFKRLEDEFALTITEIAKRIGKSASFISNSVRLLSLPDAIKDGLISGTTTEGHARALLMLEEPKLMVEVYRMVLAENASVRRTEELARRVKQKISPEKVKRLESKIVSEEIEKIADDIGKALDGKVKVYQSSIMARIHIVIRGRPEQTTEAIKKLHQKLTS